MGVSLSDKEAISSPMADVTCILAGKGEGHILYLSAVEHIHFSTHGARPKFYRTAASRATLPAQNRAHSDPAPSWVADGEFLPPGRGAYRLYGQMLIGDNSDQHRSPA